MADAAQSGADTINQQPPLVLARRCRWLLLAFGALLSVAMLDAAGPDRRTVEPWLGTFAAGAERIGLRWTEAGLHVELGNVTVPVDGAWHETVPTFAVRQRATWLTTTHIYKYTNEPEVEHEKYALAELLARKLPYVWPGPDVWTATKARWPEVFTQPDQVHLNNAGDALDARLWYAHLLRYDRGELEPTLESAWGANWRPSATLRERQTRTQ